MLVVEEVVVDIVAGVADSVVKGEGLSWIRD